MAISAFSIPIQLPINTMKALNDHLMRSVFEKKEEFYSIKKVVYEDSLIKITENITFFLKEQSEELPISYFRTIFNNNILATFVIFFISGYIFNKSMENRIDKTQTKSKNKKALKLINLLLKRGFINLRNIKGFQNRRRASCHAACYSYLFN